MLKLKSILSIFFLVYSFSCTQKKVSKRYDDVSDIKTISSDTINSLIDLSIVNGDTISYQRIRNYYFIRGQYPLFLNYSLVMANKHHYNMAYYDVYYILTHSKWGTSLSGLDSATRKLAVTYLQKSYLLNYVDAINEWGVLEQ